MSKIQIALIVFATLTIPGLIGLMFVLQASTADMYATQGESLHFQSVLVPAMTILPIPLIVAMVAVIVFAVNKSLERMLKFLMVLFCVQSALFLSIPVLLAALENELNAPVVILSGLCFNLSTAFVLFLALIRNIVTDRAESVKSADDAKFGVTV